MFVLDDGLFEFFQEGTALLASIFEYLCIEHFLHILFNLLDLHFLHIFTVTLYLSLFSFSAKNSFNSLVMMIYCSLGAC